MLTIYNTLTNKKEPFAPQEAGKVKIYNCGPTVYDYAHIGNLNAFLVADVLRRYLEYQGFEVRQIMNITDVGHLTADDINQADSGQDKMLKAALREKKTPLEIADFYTERFFEDIDKLNIKKASYYPRATAHIPQMIKIIQMLIDKGLAYESNGNVFYEVEKFQGYGKLSKKKLEALKHGARLEDHPDKRHHWDFALWLKAPKEHILKWESPWSLGYPGWHIECSAMSMEYLGETLDIHTGGEDHIFPHHENEIAQSEGATDKPFSLYWLHNRFLLIDGAKMSKSKGNFYILQNILEKGFTPMDFRLLVISSHYRSNLNFSWDALEQAKINLEKISRFVEELQNFDKKSAADFALPTFDATAFLQRFEAAMDDDLNTPLALSVLYDLISQFNKKKTTNTLSPQDARLILGLWEKMNQVFGLHIQLNTVPAEIQSIAEKRQKARIEKDFDTADRLRQEIESQGFTVEDSANGPLLRRK